jgi:hypothetical protein
VTAEDNNKSEIQVYCLAEHPAEGAKEAKMNNYREEVAHP